MSYHVLLLSASVLVLAVVVVLLLVRSSDGSKGAIETDQLNSALGRTLSEMRFGESVARIETHAENVEELHGNIRRLLRAPQARGEFGELQLDVILDDHLPKDMYGIRKRVVGNRTPDAHIRSPQGLVCIDSKFPLDNFEKYTESTTEAERTHYKSEFRTDVTRQLDKIASDYVRPDEGTTPFAFAFIPSEAVYYHLIREEHDLLRAYAGKGVQVVSPLTLGQKLELIKAGVHAQQLSEEAEQVQQRLDAIATRFDDFTDEWSVLETHIRNAKNKFDDVDAEFDRLETEFRRVEEFSDS